MKKALLVLFAAGMLFAGCQKQEEAPAVSPDVTAPAATDQAPVVSTDTVAAPVAPETK